MKDMWLIITLKTDMCTSSGAAIPGMIDTEIAQQYGLPFIPAKRLRGCLNNIGMELCDNIKEMQEAYKSLFGIPGQEKSSFLFLSDAHLYKIPVHYINNSQEITIENYEELKEQIKRQKEWRENILDIFTRFRTQTAIEEKNKTAKSQSLRTIRVVNKGLVFRAKLKLKENTKEIEEFLEYCVKGLRHIGIGVTRGLGEVQCELKEMQREEKQGKFKSQFQKGTEEKMIVAYRLSLKKPVLIGDSNETCFDQIPGRAILGAMAEMYIEDCQLGEDAHLDREFHRIFLEQELQFQTAFPEIKGRVFYPCPHFIKRFKRENTYINLIKGKIEEGRKVQTERASISFEEPEAKILFYLPEKEVRMHHARPLNRGIGHAFEEGEEDRSYTGQLYSYTSLCEGQHFQGQWIGKKKDIEILADCLKKRENHLWLGRSKAAEYGEVEWEWIETKERRERKIKAGQNCILWLLTPMLLRNKKNCRIEPKPELFFHLLEQRLGVQMEKTDSYLGFTEVAGYHSKWKLPKPQQIALDAGTTLVIKFKEDISASEIENQGWGIHTNQGYGQVKVLLDSDIQKKEYQREEIVLLEESKLDVDTSQIIEKLKSYQMQKEKEEEEEREAVHKIEKNKEYLRNISNTTLYQILELIKKYKEKEDYYKNVEEQLKEICDEEKKEAAEKLIKCCEKKSFHFTQTYIQYAIWYARRM